MGHEALGHRGSNEGVLQANKVGIFGECMDDRQYAVE